MKHTCLWTIGLLLIFGAQVAESRISWHTPGQYRLLTYLTDGYVLDADARQSKQNWARHRLRIQPSMSVGFVSVNMELDVLSGQVWGTTHTTGSRYEERRHVELGNAFDGWTTLEPRQAWLELRGPHLSLRVGQMGRQWGLGLQSNETDWQIEGFVPQLGDRWNGDLIDQLLIEARPFARIRADGLSNFKTSFYVGSIFQDEYASLLDGSEKYIFGSSAVLPLDTLSVGSRVQRSSVTGVQGDVVEYVSYGGFARWSQPILPLGSVVIVASEFVWQHAAARENVAVPEADADTYDGYGAVTAIEYFLNCPQVGLRFEGGISSGDGGISGESVFHFDPDYAPTALALPVVERWLSAHYAERLADASGGTVPGVTRLASDGAVRSLRFLSVRGAHRHGAFKTVAGVSWLWRDGALRSGLPNHNTLTIGKRDFVGQEVVLRSMINLEDFDGHGWRMGVQWGSFLPYNLSFLDKAISRLSIRSEVNW